MNIVVPLVAAATFFANFSARTLPVATMDAGQASQTYIAGNDLPGDPYDPGPYGPNPRGGNPHGGDPHDENHDPSLPSNEKELERKNPDPRSPLPGT